MCRELGVFRLADSHDHAKCVTHAIVNEKDIEVVLSIVEVSLAIAGNSRIRQDYSLFRNALEPSEASDELNARFREHGVGFQLEAGRIMRVDSQYVHAEAVKPALALLADKRYAGAQAEFLKAHEHYRTGNHGEALNECLKAFESTLKVICGLRGWPIAANDPAAKLVKAVLDNGLIPEYMESKLTGLRAVLEGAIPTPRNRESGHGAGATPKVIPEHLAAYVLHMTASTIVFLVEAEKHIRP